MHLMTILQLCLAMEHGDATVRQQSRQSFRHRLHRGRTEVTQPAEVNALQCGIDAHTLRLTYVLHAMRGRQQRLRWNASTIEASASQGVVTLDHCHRFAKLSST